MDFEHRIMLPNEAQFRSLLERAGIHTTGASEPSPWIFFEIKESDPHWKEVESLLADRPSTPDFVTTLFSSEEIDKATWFEVNSLFCQGHPQPDDNWLGASFDLSNFCKMCRVGARQARPFIMKKPPSWGRNRLMQLFGVLDELFAKPDLYEEVFLPLGIGMREVVNRKGHIIQSVVQLDTGTETASVDTSALSFHDCIHCGSRKYALGTRGYFPPLIVSSSGHLARTQEYFGPAKIPAVGRPILISQTLRKAIERAGVHEAVFRPLANR